MDAKSTKPVDGITEAPKRLSPEELEKVLARQDAMIAHFDSLRKKYGDHALEKKLLRLPSVRKFYQRYSIEDAATRVDIDELYSHDDGSLHMEDQVAARLELEQLEASLTPRQLRIFTLYKQGKVPREIKELEGYNTENAIRYQKFLIKKKYEMNRRKNA